MMTEVEAKMLRYVEQFGSLPNSRLVPCEVFDRMDELIAMALERGTPLTKDELQLANPPKGVMI